MQPVKRATPKLKMRPDPAPSRWSYRYQRLMLTPLFRRLLRVGVPVLVMLGGGLAYFADAEHRDAFAGGIAEMRHQIETRPEFMVNFLEVEGASSELEEDIREIFPHDLPSTSFDIDLEAVRETIEDLPAVADVMVRIRHGGVLVANVSEREPVAVWRSWDGIGVVDAEGVLIGELGRRSDRQDLPVLAGEGANKHVPEALDLIRAAAPLRQRLRGLVRMGERRWDVVLDRGQRILLPEQNPVRALERVIVLNDVQDMLERDLVAVDMRLSSRPTIRMTDNATTEWWRITKMTFGADEE